MNNYYNETRKRWGNTESYKEYEQKTANYNADKWQVLNEGLMSIFAEFAKYKQEGSSTDSNVTQELVNKLQNYITENYYTCSNKILLGLGQMYIADERFKNNIDKYGIGTAKYVSEAISIYCK